jgi:hypothetical protein
METKLQCSLKVTEDTLDESKMRLVRSMHVKTYLLVNILNIRSCQCEILKSTNKTLVLSSIRNKLTICVRKLGLSINECQGRVTLSHAGMLKKISGILSLGDEHAFRRFIELALHRNS